MNQPTVEQPVVAPSHLRERRRSIIYALLLVALGVITTVIIGASVNRERQNATSRADNAVAAMQQACAQVQRLGGQCAAAPPAGQGRPPTDAEMAAAVTDYLARHPVSGQPPTDAQIAAAVADYLAANPPPAGAAGAAGTSGPPGPSCPDGWHLQQVTIMIKGGGGWQPGLICVR